MPRRVVSPEPARFAGHHAWLSVIPGGVLRRLVVALGAIGVATVGVGVGGGLGGCALHKQAAPDRNQLVSEGDHWDPAIPADAWPARRTEILSDLQESVPEVYSIRVRWRDEDNDGDAATRTEEIPILRVRHSGLYGQGILLSVERLTPPAKDERPSLDNKGERLRFVSFATADSIDPDRPRRIFNGPGGTPDAWSVLRTGVLMRLYRPETGAPKGLVVHLSSYGGFKFEQPIVASLLSHGWAVLRVAAPNLQPRQSLKLTVASDADLDAAATKTAALIDDRMAEHAYAVEAAIAYIRSVHRDIPTRPLVVAGYSAGAIVAPTVVARLASPPDGAVLVCGGANVLDISQRSEFTNGGIEIDWKEPRGSEEDKSRLSALYLERTRLDPFCTAPLLRTIPVLQLHAMQDGIVPSSAGDLLYERLARPERIEFPLMGHTGAFWLLPGQADSIVNWIESLPTVMHPTAHTVSAPARGSDS